jgi:hypothetical protein
MEKGLQKAEGRGGRSRGQRKVRRKGGISEREKRGIE